MTEHEQLKALVKSAAIALSEHCDSVRIFCTKHACDGETDTSAAVDYGSGNFYAQMGQIEEWLGIQKEYQRCWAKRKDNEENDSDESK